MFVRAGGMIAFVTAMALSGAHAAGSAEEAGFIAGLVPDERPAHAPVVLEYVKDAGWYERALCGVDRPYPSSLRFLEDQGAWFTPFVHAGMPGRYDLRQLHDPDAMQRCSESARPEIPAPERSEERDSKP